MRLDAELIRDNALAVSGLLSPKIGGPSVKPYQPAGYWAYLNFPTREWANDQGENQYRRGLYTWWQRTFLHPSLQAFDAPTREECTVGPGALEHPAASTRAVERSDLCRSRARVRRADYEARGHEPRAADRLGVPPCAVSRGATAEEIAGSLPSC